MCLNLVCNTFIEEHEKIPPEEATKMLKVKLISPGWDGIGHFKVAWYIFSEFTEGTF